MAPRTRYALALLLTAAVLLPLPGCRLWNGFLDLLKWRGPGFDNPEPNPRFPLVQGPPQPGNVDPALQRVALYTITLPVGTFTGNDKAWAQLNEDVVDSRTAVLMAQNGLRAATGPVTRWNLVQSLVDMPGALVSRALCETTGRGAVNLITHANIPDQIVVSVDRDLQQQGRTFERCDDGFRLSMVAVRGKAQLVVMLEPIVTLGGSGMGRSGGMGGVPGAFTSEEALSDLRITASLKPDQFLVVSAVDPRSSRFSVGTLWLSDMDKVPATETVLVFVPATAAPAPR